MDPHDPLQRLADDLVAADEGLLDKLVELRRDTMSQAVVAERMGITQSAVARIESGDRDPRLSTLRRYAHAVRALVTHTVTPRSTTPMHLQATHQDDWGRVGD